MKLSVCISLSLVVSVLLSACATFEKGRPQAVVVLSFPTGAQVYINGEEAGVTPLELQLPRKLTYQVRLEKEGYNSAVKYFTPVPNEASKAFIRFGLSEDLGYYVDLEPGRMQTQMKSELVPPTVGA